MLPVLIAVANPVLLIVATVVLLDVQVAELVRFCWLLSLYVPVAVNCWVAFFKIDGLMGEIAKETRVGAVTVRVVEPAIDPEVA